MEIKIKGEATEIAALVVAIQERRDLTKISEEDFLAPLKKLQGGRTAQ